MSKKMDQQFACSKMMLPEHRGCLRDKRARDRRAEENSRPDLDEQERERLQRVFEEALALRRVLQVTFFTATGRETFTGVPLRSDSAGNRIIFSVEAACCRAIRTADIFDLEPADRR